MESTDKKVQTQPEAKKPYTRPRLERKRSLVRATLFSGASPAVVGGGVP